MFIDKAFEYMKSNHALQMWLTPAPAKIQPSRALVAPLVACGPRHAANANRSADKEKNGNSSKSRLARRS